MKKRRPRTLFPPNFMTLGINIPKYRGEIPIFDPSDIIEGEEAIKADDEEQKRKLGEETNAEQSTDI